MTNTQWRLESKAPRLASAFRQAAHEQQRNATLGACEAVVSIVGLEANDDVAAALVALRQGQSDDSALRDRLSALAACFDEEYFRLDEDGSEAARAEALRFFAKARGASAVAFAFSDDASQLHESIYEAISALPDDPSRVLRVVEAALLS